MVDKISLHRSDVPLPCPCIYLPDAEALGRWHTAILADAYDRGERTLTLHCFPSLASCGVMEAALVILRAATDFLYAHEDVSSLQLFCEGEEVFRVFSLQWNTYCAALKPGQRG